MGAIIDQYKEKLSLVASHEQILEDAKVNFSSWVKIIQLFDNTIGKKIKASSMCDVEE